MWRNASRLIFGLVWLFAVAADSPAPPKAGAFPDEKIPVGQQTREYRLVVPETVDLSKPAPLVFAFHGMGEDNKDHMPVATGLNDLAKAHKFILVYPGAAVRPIPAGLVKAWALTPEHATEDLAFFDALLAKLAGQYRIDANQIFVTGMSNGAYFAHLVGRERKEVVAAVAAQSGELGLIDLRAIETGRKFPVMIVHGDADKIFPVENARRARDLYLAAGHEVTYLEVPGLGHEWATKININEKIWDFFSSHPLQPVAPAAKGVESAPAK